MKTKNKIKYNMKFKEKSTAMNKRYFGLCAAMLAALSVCTACNIEPDVIIDIAAPSHGAVQPTAAGMETLPPNEGTQFPIESGNALPTEANGTNPVIPTDVVATMTTLNTQNPATPEISAVISPVPTTVPQEKPDYSVFENCAFVGNSTFEGLYKYGIITQGSFFTRVGLNILTVYTQTTSTGSVPIIDELKNGHYEAVILMFGENELGWPNLNTFIEKYSQLLDDVWVRQPGCEIFIMGIPPVSDKVSNTSTTGVTNENIQLYNAQLVDLATRRGCHFVTVPEELMTANGSLPADASSDGIHLNLSYSRLWADHICRTVAAVLR